jgi:hypothetical protein
MIEPFSKGARPWERHATAMRRLAGVSQNALLDPWQLAPKVGLRVIDGEMALALLAEEDRHCLSGSASGTWSGGVWPEPLPDGSRLCILNPRHQQRRNKVTLMEEITHSFLNHRPTKITLRSSAIQVRDFDIAQEKEAYGTGAAALVPWAILFGLVNQGMSLAELAERFQVSEELAEYRIKITGAHRLFLARQRHNSLGCRGAAARGRSGQTR